MNPRARLYATAILCVSLSVPSMVHAREWTLGARVGVNVADLAGEFASEAGMEPRTTFVAGIAARRSISEVFEIQLEGLYSQKGAKYSWTNYGPGGSLCHNYHTTEKLDYIDLPILLKTRLSRNPSVAPALLVCPSIGFFLTGKRDTSPSGPSEDADVNHLDLGIVLGLELQNGDYHGYVVDARYTRSLHTISDVFFVEGGSPELLNSVISLSVGVH